MRTRHSALGKEKKKVERSYMDNAQIYQIYHIEILVNFMGLTFNFRSYSFISIDTEPSQCFMCKKCKYKSMATIEYYYRRYTLHIRF